MRGYKGRYVFQNTYQEGLMDVFRKLGKDKDLVILSGDNDGEKKSVGNDPKCPTLLNKTDDKLVHQVITKSKAKSNDGWGRLIDAGALAWVM